MAQQDVSAIVARAPLWHRWSVTPAPPSPPPGASAGRIAIALCTLNGAGHLAAQLDSYEAQDIDNWDLWVSDDGSTDATHAILADYASRWQGRHRITLLEGPRRGVAANFLSLLCHPALPADRPVALSDQDDVWYPDKLRRAVQTMSRAGRNARGRALLYGARSLHVDAMMRPLGRSRMPRRPPSLANAITQNIVSGHSAVLNPAALEVVRRAGEPQDVPYHDWWLYQLITAAGGQVLIEDAVVLAYRQHHANAMGAHRGLSARAERIGTILSGTYGDWIRRNLSALSAVSAGLTPPARAMVAELGGGKRRIGPRQLRRTGLYRQSRTATAALYAAALLGRL